MHGLGVPVTRALCLAGSDHQVYREQVETGAMLVRMALCHVRFGTFGQHATQLLALHEAQSSLQGHVQLLGSGIDQDTGVALARIIHERFCCNHGFAAVISLDAVGMVSRQAGSPFGRSTYCFKYASLPRGSARLSRLATARFRHEPS